VATDNKNVKKAVQEALEALQKEIFIKNACFVSVQSNFEAVRYLRARADAELDFLAAARPPATRPTGIPKDVPHPILYARLKKWREDSAATHDVELYAVLATRSLLEIVEQLPLNVPMLKKIKGIGTVKLKQFGAELIAMVRDYCTEYNIPTEQLEEMATEVTAEKPVKIDTKTLSFDLFKSGKTVEEIARERSLALSTIEGHLGHFIGLGQIDIFQLMQREQVDEIEAYFREQNTTASAAAKAYFGDKYSYGQLKMVLDYMNGGEPEV